jgi:hypothetical protein
MVFASRFVKMTRSIFIVLAVGFLFSSRTLVAKPSDETTQIWKFPSKDGVTQISLTSFKGEGYASLGIWSEGGAHPSMKEEAVFFDQVLGSLPQGVSLDRLSFIQLRLQEPDVLKQVAGYAAQSKKWRPALKSKSVPEVYGLITDFLNKSNAYADLNTTFVKHGLMIHVAGVEKVNVQDFSKSGASCPPATNCQGLLVPSDAQV